MGWWRARVNAWVIHEKGKGGGKEMDGAKELKITVNSNRS